LIGNQVAAVAAVDARHLRPHVAGRGGELSLEVGDLRVEPGDHVLVMSNGGFGGIHEKLLARLGKSA